MRKPVQITVGSSDEFGDVLYSLCNDGSLWMINVHRPNEAEGKWKEIEPIPDTLRQFEVGKK
jgi:hypothetical protein